jgi:hypothetical protein
VRYTVFKPAVGTMYLTELISSTCNELTRCEQKQRALEEKKRLKWQNNHLKNSGKYIYTS